MAFCALLAVYVTCLVALPWGCHGQDQGPTVTVSTPLGNVSGRVTVVLDRNVYQFLGVPYAQPPLNQLRFSKPVPVQAWSPRTLDATRFGPSCPQGDQGDNEDCLYLNIYVRANDTISSNLAGLKPVMLWIHGGGFEEGSGSGSDGTLMAVRGNVVVVTINYRLGMLGWLSTLDAESPGNYGLWDQRTSIEWVRNNIASFGGDPNQITIFGESAGGYSVGLHAVSPINNGLFHKVIMQSGTALNRRTIHLDPRGFAERFAQNLGCLRRSTDGSFDTRFLITCARERSVNDILAATGSAGRRDYVAWVLDMAPVIDGELIPTDVRTLLAAPQYRDRIPFWNIDVMVGTTNAEGSLVTYPLVPFQRDLGFNLANGIPTRVLCTNVTTALSREYFRGSQAVSDAMCQQYTSRRGDADQGRQVVDLYGDMMFVAPAVETLLLHSNTSLPSQQPGNRGRTRTTYQYLFAHSPRQTEYQWFQGAGHGAEVNYVFGMFMSDQNEARLSLAMMDGWTNFATYGTPNAPQNPAPAFVWPVYTPTNRAFTNLDLNLSSQTDIYAQRMRFWLQTIPDMNTESGRPTPAPQPGQQNFVTSSASGTARWGLLGSQTTAAVQGTESPTATNSGVSVLIMSGGLWVLLFSLVKCLSPSLLAISWAK